MKRSISLVLCALMVVAALPFCASAVTSGTIGKEGNLSWSYKDDVLTISGEGFMSQDWDECFKDGYPLWGRLDFTSVVIEEGVLNIEEWAFMNCKSLEKISLPSTLFAVDWMTFIDCVNLKEIELAENSPYFTLKHGVLFNKNCTEILLYPAQREGTEYAIPKGVTSIGRFAFANSSNLESVTIPDTVNTIKTEAFAYCEKIQEFVIPDSVTCIMDGAFYYCKSLRSINIPAGVKEIINCTFAVDYALERVIFEGKPDKICDQAFDGAENLKDVYYVGSEADKEKIEIGSDNEYLVEATWHCNVDLNSIPHLEVKEPEIKDDILIYFYSEGYITCNYKTTVRLRAEVADDVSIIWYVNGKPVSNKMTVEIKDATEDFTVEIIATQKNGMQSKQIQEYKIKQGFFDKLYWFIMHYIYPEYFVRDLTRGV